MTATDTNRFWFILSDGQPMDGEFYSDRAKLFGAMRYAQSGDCVHEFIADEGTARDVTEDMAWDAFRAMDWTDINGSDDLPPIIGQHIGVEAFYAELNEVIASQRGAA